MGGDCKSPYLRSFKSARQATRKSVFYLAALALRAERDKKSANTRANTIPVLTPISIKDRLKYSVVFSFFHRK